MRDIMIQLETFDLAHTIFFVYSQELTHAMDDPLFGLVLPFVR